MEKPTLQKTQPYCKCVFCNTVLPNRGINVGVEIILHKPPHDTWLSNTCILQHKYEDVKTKQMALKSIRIYKSEKHICMVKYWKFKVRKWLFYIRWSHNSNVQIL